MQVRFSHFNLITLMMLMQGIVFWEGFDFRRLGGPSEKELACRPHHRVAATQAIDLFKFKAASSPFSPCGKLPSKAPDRRRGRGYDGHRFRRRGEALQQ
jgi:hypothetical protein